MKMFVWRHRDKAEIASAVLEGIWEVRRKYGGGQSRRLLIKVVSGKVIDRLREAGYISRPHVKWRGGGAHGDALNFVERIPDLHDRPCNLRDAAEYEDLVRSISGVLDLPAESVRVLKEYNPEYLHVQGSRTIREQNRTSHVLWKIRRSAARHRAVLMGLFGIDQKNHQ